MSPILIDKIEFMDDTDQLTDALMLFIDKTCRHVQKYFIVLEHETPRAAQATSPSSYIIQVSLSHLLHLIHQTFHWS